MSLPFTVEQFFDVFARYNEAVWPAQLVLAAMWVAAVALLVVPLRGTGRVISGILAFLWGWMAVGYHLAFFSAINPAARLFAAIFIVQAALLAWVGVVRGRLEYRPDGGWRGWAGGALLVYGFAGYPLVGYLAGHQYPAMPTFGIPCPTTIVTIGMLLCLRRPAPRWPLVIPIAWSAVGTSAAVQLGVPQDYGLTVAGLLGLVSVMASNRPR